MGFIRLSPIQHPHYGISLSQTQELFQEVLPYVVCQAMTADGARRAHMELKKKGVTPRFKRYQSCGGMWSVKQILFSFWMRGEANGQDITVHLPDPVR